MGFLAPFIPALIGAGGSVGAGLLAGRKSKEEREALSAQTRLAQLEELASSRGFERSKEITPFTNRFLTRGSQGMGSSMDYWSKILSGRESASSLLSPEINQITDNFSAAREASRTLNPRGGGSSAFTREIDEAVVPGQIGGLLATARPRAASEMGALGTNMSSLGRDLASVETGLLRGVSPGSAGSLLNYGLNRRAQDLDIGSTIGRSLFQFMQMFQGGGGGAPFPGGTGSGGNIPSQFPPNPRPGPPQMPPGMSPILSYGP